MGISYRSHRSDGNPLVERVVNFGRHTPLTGILTLPAGELSKGMPCIVILNAGIVRKAGPNGSSTFLARALAGEGYPVFRLDFAGVGDSPNRRDGLSLRDGAIDDIKQCLDMLEGVLGAQRFFLAGLCSGADLGLQAACGESKRVVGLVMLDPTITRTWRWHVVDAIRRVPRWVSVDFWRTVLTLQHPRIRAMLAPLLRKGGKGVPGRIVVEEPELYTAGLETREEIRDCLQKLCHRRVALCFSFSGSWARYYNYKDQLYDVYPELSLRGKIGLLHFPAVTHTFSGADQQQALADGLSDWLRTLALESPRSQPASGDPSTSVYTETQR